VAEDLYLRQIVETDLQFVYELVQNTIQVSYSDVYPPEAIEFFRNYHRPESISNDATMGYVVVAESNGQILGTGTLLGTNIRRVFVKPEHQRKGIGKLIARELERKANSDGLYKLDLSSSLKSRHFWETEGYILLGEFFLPVSNNKKLIFYEMSKTLLSSH
jgi:GNAT superfamily N-acetyltransferase